MITQDSVVLCGYDFPVSATVCLSTNCVAFRSGASVLIRKSIAKQHNLGLVVYRRFLKEPVSTIVLETKHLILRKLSTDDAEFILKLLNEPSFLHYIGDKGVRSLDDARQYILNGPVDSYERNGFGLFLVELKKNGIPIGISGLVKRDTLPDADIGFAFLPEYWSKGYAFESAAAVMSYAKEKLGLNRILAITSPDNEASAKLLGKIGLRFERMIRLTEDAPEIQLFTS